MYRVCIALVIAVSFLNVSHAQNPLPEFSVENLGKDRIRISWVNPFAEGCVQLSVQRSFDSVRFFRTFFSTPSPELPQNGVVDINPLNAKIYYRIFYVLQGGAYYFTKAKFPVTGYASDFIEKNLNDGQLITVRLNDAVYTQLDYNNYQRFRDSILGNTKDSLFNLGQDEVLLKRYDGGAIWTPSAYVFTNSDGYVDIRLPEAKQKKYKITVFDSDGKRIFYINQINETELILDKTNFVHAGWFTFELYENDKLKERNKFYLQREF